MIVYTSSTYLIALAINIHILVSKLVVDFHLLVVYGLMDNGVVGLWACAYRSSI